MEFQTLDEFREWLIEKRLEEFVELEKDEISGYDWVIGRETAKIYIQGELEWSGEWDYIEIREGDSPYQGKEWSVFVFSGTEGYGKVIN